MINTNMIKTDEKIPLDKYERQVGNPGSVINTDHSSLDAYKKRKQRENEINTLKEEVSEIKQMLLQLIAKESTK
jgi:hypothetical protein